MEASALTHASRRGLLARRSRVLRLQKDERLIAMMRDGHLHAFEVLFDRYHGRLLAFCRHMLPSQQDAEDILQDVFVAAHKAILADNRHIKVKPWLYRIARNRCLNHLRRPVAQGSDELMDEHVGNGGTTTADQVQTRQELREILRDVTHLPETQRTALLLREVDALSYAEIAETMDTTVPAVKSLLVRARITLAESSQARLLTCNEVRIELAEAAEGLGKASGPVRQHVKGCEACKDFREELRSNGRAFAVLFPIGPLALLKASLLAKLGGAGSGVGGGAAAASGIGAGSGAGGAAIGGAAAAGGGGLGAIGGAIGTKAVAGVATAAIVAAGAVEVKRHRGDRVPATQVAIEREATPPAPTPSEPRATKPKRGPEAAAVPAVAADDEVDADPSGNLDGAESSQSETAAAESSSAEDESSTEADDTTTGGVEPGSEGKDGSLTSGEGPIASGSTGTTTLATGSDSSGSSTDESDSAPSNDSKRKARVDSEEEPPPEE